MKSKGFQKVDATETQACLKIVKTRCDFVISLTILINLAIPIVDFFAHINVYTLFHPNHTNVLAFHAASLLLILVIFFQKRIYCITMQEMYKTSRISTQEIHFDVSMSILRNHRSLAHAFKRACTLYSFFARPCLFLCLLCLSYFLAAPISNITGFTSYVAVRLYLGALFMFMFVVMQDLCYSDYNLLHVVIYLLIMGVFIKYFRYKNGPALVQYNMYGRVDYLAPPESYTDYVYANFATLIIILDDVLIYSLAGIVALNHYGFGAKRNIHMIALLKACDSEVRQVHLLFEAISLAEAYNDIDNTETPAAYDLVSIKRLYMKTQQNTFLSHTFIKSNIPQWIMTYLTGGENERQKKEKHTQR